MTRPSRCILSLSLLMVPAGSFAESPQAIRAVAATPGFFNPTAGQQAAVSFELARPGRLLVTLLDRDRVQVRRLAEEDAAAGSQRMTWDGRDDAGVVVPDEAYTVRIELAHADGTEVYDPAAEFVPVLETPAAAEYSRVRATLSYRLARPSRVHVQAGQGRMSPKTGEVEGPVLKTVLDRAPRVAGAVVESWNGLDESGTVYVPDLPHFAVAVLAASLPESAIITVGNRERSFADYERQRRSLQPRTGRAVSRGRHHAGLTSLEDRSPPLDLQVENVTRSRGRHSPEQHSLAVTARLAAEHAPHFLSQPTHFLVFVDDRLVLRRKRPRNPARIALPPQRLAPGAYRVVVNWTSEYGPVAVGVARIVVPEPREEGTR